MLILLFSRAPLFSTLTMDVADLAAFSSLLGSIILLTWAFAHPGESAVTPAVWSTGPAAACGWVLQAILVRAYRPQTRPSPAEDEDGARRMDETSTGGPIGVQGNDRAAPECTPGMTGSGTGTEESPAGPEINEASSGPGPSMTPSTQASTASRTTGPHRIGRTELLPHQFDIVRRTYYPASGLLVTAMQFHAVFAVTMAVLGLRNIRHPDLSTIAGLVTTSTWTIGGFRLWLKEWAAGANTKQFTGTDNRPLTGLTFLKHTYRYDQASCALACPRRSLCLMSRRAARLRRHQS